jgi:hypothetical protein
MRSVGFVFEFLFFYTWFLSVEFGCNFGVVKVFLGIEEAGSP